MIWIWIGQLVDAFLRLVLLPPDGVRNPSRRISPRAKCTACGNPGGTLKYSRVSGDKGQTPREGKPVILWTCSTCAFECCEDLISFHKYPVK